MSWKWTKSSKDINNLISQNEGVVQIKLLLSENSYSPILDGIEFDGSNWGKLIKLDFSDLSLRHCNFKNIKSHSLIFSNSDLESATIENNCTLDKLDLSNAKIKNFVTKAKVLKEINLEMSVLNKTVIVSDEKILKGIKNEKELMHINIPPSLLFNQDDLLKHNPSFDKLGVCNGLTMDYAVHAMNQNQDHYINTLFREQSAPSQQFFERIKAYQNNLQTFELSAVNEITLSYSALIKGGFVDLLPDHLKNSKIWGVTIAGPIGSHIISVTSSGDGYIIFDSNLGFINCGNVNLLEKQIRNLYFLYSKQLLAFKSLRVSDISKIVNTLANEDNKILVSKYNLFGLYCALISVFSLTFLSLFQAFDVLGDISATIIATTSSFAISIGISPYLSQLYKKYAPTYTAKV